MNPSTRNIGGRPTIRTPENRAKIIAEVRAGTPKTCAAVSIGMSQSTFFVWQRHDAEFAEAIRHAEAQFAEKRVARPVRVRPR